MADMEYKTVPLPTTPRKFKGLKNPVDRVSRTMTEILNEESRGGWAFLRAERLELELRGGMLRRKNDVEVTLLVFGRERGQNARPNASQRTEPQAAPRPVAKTTPTFDDSPSTALRSTD